MLIPDVALRFCSEDETDEPVVVATTKLHSVVQFVAIELAREAEAAAADIAGLDPVLSRLLDAEAERLRLVYGAVQAQDGELRLVPPQERS
ncbi:MAG: hypothetical protein HYR74_12550 [Candidatus Eisenbacteria bacterium]|nr:hypothetical protein [Candidatus Eisenbacteria bacterium]